MPTVRRLLATLLRRLPVVLVPWALAACGGGELPAPPGAAKQPLAVAQVLRDGAPAAREMFGTPGRQDALDMNGDARADLLWHSPASGDTVGWFMQGAALAGGSSFLRSADYSVVGTADLNGDGRSDLVWRNRNTGEVVVWLIDGALVIQSASLPIGPDQGSGFRVIGAPDLNGDGKSDLLWARNATGEQGVWLMDGVQITTTMTLDMPATARVVAMPDLDGDGKTDLVFHDPTTGKTTAWRMDGASSIERADVAVHPGFRVIATPDLDGDGRSDLIWNDPFTGQTLAWLMNGVQPKGSALLLVDASFSVIATPDLNGDGRSDLLWFNATTGQTVAWLMEGLQLTGGGVLLTHPSFKVVGTPDLDGNGYSDLVWYSPADGQTVAWIMNGMSLVGGGVLLTDPAFKLSAIDAAVDAAPVAVPGEDLRVLAGNFVTLDGQASSDPEGRPLRFAWTLIARPEGSQAELFGSNTATPTFRADLPGIYRLALTVNDGAVSSAAATVSVTAIDASVQLFGLPSASCVFNCTETPLSLPIETNASSNSTCSGNGCPAVIDIAGFRLLASGARFTIAGLTAQNLTEGSTVTPTISGLVNGQVIEDGQAVTFRLLAPRTLGATVNLRYFFAIAETGQVFAYNVQLRTN